MFGTIGQQWHINLAADYRPLLDRVLRLSANGFAWEGYLRAPDMAELWSLRDALSTLLWERHGITLLRIGDGMPDDAMRLLFLLVGRALGRNVGPPLDAEPRPLFAITATGDPTIGGIYAGNGRNAAELALHTDGSGIHNGRVDILGMLCIRAAEEGGISRFADAHAVYSQLDDEVKTTLASAFPRVNPYEPHLSSDRLTCRPVYETTQAGLCFSYHPQRVRDGIRLRAGGLMPPTLEQAFANLDETLDRSAAELLLGRGDMIFLDNRIIAHGRTAFVDSNRPRLLERLWVEIEP